MFIYKCVFIGSPIYRYTYLKEGQGTQKLVYFFQL